MNRMITCGLCAVLLAGCECVPVETPKVEAPKEEIVIPEAAPIPAIVAEPVVAPIVEPEPVAPVVEAEEVVVEWSVFDMIGSVIFVLTAFAVGYILFFTKKKPETAAPQPEVSEEKPLDVSEK